jgi:hypothetical protein
LLSVQVEADLRHFPSYDTLSHGKAKAFELTVVSIDQFVGQEAVFLPYNRHLFLCNDISALWI